MSRRPGGDAQSFGALIRSDYRKWEPVVNHDAGHRWLRSVVFRRFGE
jgi:hypothetical protein